MRAVIYVLGGAPATDERNFKRLRASRAKLKPSSSLSEFKRLVREQFFILKLDREQALSTLPVLLEGEDNAAIDGHLEHLEHVFSASGELTAHAAERFEQVKALFGQARPVLPATVQSSEAEPDPKPQVKPENKPEAKAEVVTDTEGATTQEAKPSAASSAPAAAAKKTAARSANARRGTSRKR